MAHKFLFVSTHFAPDFQYGGVVESSTKLYQCLCVFGDFCLATASRDPKKTRRVAGAATSCYQSLVFHRFAFAPEAIPGLWRDIAAAEGVFINGIFTWLTTLAQLYAVILGKPFIVSVRGGIEPWRLNQKKIRKYIFLRYLALPLMRRAAYIHATSDAERINLNKLGFYNIIQVPNGVDSSSLSVDGGNSPVRQKFIFLFLSRTDKEKGLDILLDAYRRFCQSFPINRHVLSIVGPDMQGYFRGMNLNLPAENILYSSGVYGDAKANLIRSSDCLVLPSYSENFGNVVAEALACETPVITTTGTPWAEIERVGCGLYVKPEAEALYQAMRTMYLKAPEERREMGRRGREYVLKNFDWEDKARELFEHLKKLVPSEKA